MGRDARDARSLREAAERAGIEPTWRDVEGRLHTVPDATLEALLAVLGETAGSAGVGEATVAESASALSPRELGLERAIAVSCQVYGLRSARNLGIGDFEDVARLAETSASFRVDALALSPLHARFPLEPSRASPYAPSSRRFLDPLLIAVDRAAAALGLPEPSCPEAAELRERELVDHPRVAEVKGRALAALWCDFEARHLGDPPSPIGAAFRAWRTERGEPLERFARFEAIAAHLAAATGRISPPAAWPAALRRPDSTEVERLARGPLARAVSERAFLQWLAESQLAEAHERARRAGMRIGLATDFAVGVGPDSADAWAWPEAIVRGVSIGAPPDAFAPEGQCWSLAPLSPTALLAFDLEPWRGDLEAATAHAGLVRIDHVMGLSRQFWVPDGARPIEGAYVRFPEARLLSALAALSWRRRCLVQGEDLGTLPEGFRDRLARAGILGSRVLWFERWPSGLFKASRDYPALAVASISTHDLPTARGWLVGRDLDWRERLGLLDAAAVERARAERARDRRILLDALAFEGIACDPADDESIVLALHRLLARSPAAILLVQLEDLVGSVEQANLPGTVDEHPNWRRRYPIAIERIGADPRVRELLAAVRSERAA